MALSKKEKEYRLEIIHEMMNLFSIDNEEVIYEESKSGSGKISDLDELQALVAGKRPPYYGSKSSVSDGWTAPIKISYLFMGNKNVKLDDNENCLFMLIDPTERGVKVRCSWDWEDIGSFYNQAKKDSSGDGTKLSDIVKECDASEIYNTYKKNALEMINRRLPTVYNLFTGGTITHRERKDIPTLRVAYVPRINKFYYEYNPIFILRTALDEWFRSDKYTYKSLKVCYSYVLAFLISHEMMHLIHHNNTSNIDVGASYDGSDNADVSRMRRLSNIYTDSFINCMLVRAFNGTSDLRSMNGYAPMLNSGIGSKIVVRAEHNVGFNSFSSTRELAEKISKIVTTTISRSDLEMSMSDRSDFDIYSYAGADVFIKIEVSPGYSPIRANSGVFQRFVNEVLKISTSGRVFSGLQISNDEKETDKDILKNGTLVRVKDSRDICIVTGHDEDRRRYKLNYTETSDVKREDLGDGRILNTPIYTDSGKSFGERRRSEIMPVDPKECGAWVEDAAQNGTVERPDPDERAKQMNFNVIDRLLKIAPRETVVALVASLLMKYNVSGTADDLVDKCIGKSENECKSILGDPIHSYLEDVFNDSMKILNRNDPTDNTLDSMTGDKDGSIDGSDTPQQDLQMPGGGSGNSYSGDSGDGEEGNTSLDDSDGNGSSDGYSDLQRSQPYDGSDDSSDGQQDDSGDGQGSNSSDTQSRDRSGGTGNNTTNDKSEEKNEDIKNFNIPTYKIGDIVYVRREDKYGKIVSMNNGMFELEEVEDVGSETIEEYDDSTVIQ